MWFKIAYAWYNVNAASRVVEDIDGLVLYFSEDEQVCVEDADLGKRILRAIELSRI